MRELKNIDDDSLSMMRNFDDKKNTQSHPKE
jgi:hypothetical protein